MKKHFIFFALMAFVLLHGCGRISPVELPEDTQFKDFSYPPKEPQEQGATSWEQPLTIPENPDAPWRDEPLQYL